VNHWLAGMVRVPAALASSISASMAAASAHHSAAGCAQATLPANVPRTRTGG